MRSQGVGLHPDNIFIIGVVRGGMRLHQYHIFIIGIVRRGGFYSWQRARSANLTSDL